MIRVRSVLRSPCVPSIIRSELPVYGTLGKEDLLRFKGWTNTEKLGLKELENL